RAAKWPRRPGSRTWCGTAPFASSTGTSASAARRSTSSATSSCSSRRAASASRRRRRASPTARGTPPRRPAARSPTTTRARCWSKRPRWCRRSPTSWTAPPRSSPHDRRRAGVQPSSRAAAGFAGVLVEGVDNAVAGEWIAARTAQVVRREALADAPKLLRLTDRLQLAAWDEVLRRVGFPTQTGQVAAALRVTREHLSREFAAGGAPNLKRVIDLARTACAADLLGNPGYTVRAVVHILGYASTSHLAGAARRVAGTTPQELRAVGPRGVLQRFIRGRTRSRV